MEPMSSSEDSDEIAVFPPRTYTYERSRKPSSTSLESGERSPDEAEYANCQMEQLPCFHAATTREKATKLLEHAAEGTYLIRSSDTETGNYSVSIREARDVKHFRIDFDGERYGFGKALFWSPLQIWGHLQERPVLECEEGIKVHLLHPYVNECNTEFSLYSTAKRHYIPDQDQMISSQTQTQTRTLGRRKRSSNTIDPSDVRRGSTIITSMEGQLYKKKEGKTWKRRWCILKENRLSYKKNEQEKKPLNELDLSKALEIKDDFDEAEKENCFRIVFAKVYFVFSANSPEDKDVWVKNIQQHIGPDCD